MAKSINRILFIVRSISETSKYVSQCDACPVFADTCLSPAIHDTSAEPLSPSRARVSQKRGYLAHVSFRPVDAFALYRTRDMRQSYLRPPFNLPRSIRVQGKPNKKKAIPRILLIFQKRNGGRPFHDGLSFAINASDRSDKIAAAVVISSFCIHSTLPAVFRLLPLGNATEAQ